MKELEIKKADNIEIQNEAKKDIQKILIGRVQPKKNHILFEVNVKEKSIVQAEYDKNLEITFTEAMESKKSNKSVSVKKECIYIYALNKKNVRKILKRNFNIEL